MFAKIISSLNANALKSTFKIDQTIDEVIEKFKDGCPPKEELKRIIAKKNTMVTTLTTLQGILESLTKTGQTIEGVLSGLQVAVQVIKLLPIPIPPFTPLTVPNTMADTLDTLGDLLKKGKGDVGMIPDALEGTIPRIEGVITKLNMLDLLLTNCIQEQGLTQEDVGEVLNNNVGPYSGEKGEWVLIKNNKFPHLQPKGIPPNPKSPFTDNNTNIWEFQITSTNVNADNTKNLLSQLQPNSNNPLMYKGFKLEIQFDPKNEFSFDSRRIKSTQKFKINKKTPKEIILYNLSNNGYSYSSSVEVLINEAKFRIDNFLNNNPQYNRLQVKPIVAPLKKGNKNEIINIYNKKNNETNRIQESN
jgi:hypothetical protein